MIKHKIDFETPTSDRYHVLTPDKCKSTSKFQKKLLHIVLQGLFQVVFRVLFLSWESRKFKNIRVVHNIFGCHYLVPLMS